MVDDKLGSRMFLRPHQRSKDGKEHIYWSLVETVRTVNGPRQRTLCYLGELNGSAQARWLKSVEVFNERRVHTVVNARVQTPDEYRRRVPKRIARLLDAIPAEVRPFVTIIDGMVSQEVIQRRVASSRIETQTRAVYIPYPALALFNTWAINGWGGSTQEPARSFYQGHAISNANKILALELTGTAAVTMLAGVAEGRRGAIVAGVICLILTLFQKLWRRIERKT